MKKYALISVSDKTNIKEFAEFLNNHNYDLISTGGTYNYLKNLNIPVIKVENITDFPEILDGRVKTLHPKIHGAILADTDENNHIRELNKNKIDLISIVIVNLYPFEKIISNKNHSWEEAIENIDIGGPTMIRSAAKNSKRVTVVFDSKDYSKIMEEIDKNGFVSMKTRISLAHKAFAYTSYYDGIINNYMQKKLSNFYLDKWAIPVSKYSKPRYGENPHQDAMVYKTSFENNSILNAKQLHGKVLSYNNYSDADSAINILKEFSKPTFISLKHKNPCGIGCDDNHYNAWRKAYEGDKTSIFGGIIATNVPISEKIAEEINNLFIEIVIAPKFSDIALKILKQKKNIRILTLKLEKNLNNNKKINSINGGLLIQDEDVISGYDTLKLVSKTNYNCTYLNDIKMALKIVKHLKSNAICVVQNGQLMGIGTGQVNRVNAVKHALDWNKDKLNNAVLASDAFFPMPDSIEIISKYNVVSIVQPGGSIKDEIIINAADKKNIEMYFTGSRHFLH